MGHPGGDPQQASGMNYGSKAQESSLCQSNNHSIMTLKKVVQVERLSRENTDWEENLASEQTVEAVTLAGGQRNSENWEETECQEEYQQGVFKEDKVVREFQEERKIQLCLRLFRVGKQGQD